MRLAILLLLALFAWEARGAAPVISCTPSVTSGTEPLGVVFDCSGTTDADTTKPFHDLLYQHNFGDTNVGTDTWAYGANTNASKNYAVGPIAAHVFESCVGSPFAVTHNVTDGTNLAYTTNSITVACANDTYSAGNTKCFYQTSATGDCPNGGSEISNADFDSALSGCIGTTKRCLFQRGSTFTASANTNVSSAGPNTIGAYGTGAKPIVSVNTGVKAIALNNAAVNDLRIMDLEFVGTGVNNPAGTESAIGLSGASVSGLTILRVTSRDMGGNGMELGAGSAGSFRTITNSVLQEVQAYNNYGGSALFARLITSAVLGSNFGPVAPSGGFFVFRSMRNQKSVIANNTFGDGPSGVETVAIRADPHVTTAEDSFYFTFTDNYVYQGTRQGPMLQYGPSGGDDRIYDSIIERNYILTQAYTGATCQPIQVSAVRVTVRNNLVNMTAPTVCARNGVRVWRAGTEPAPDDVTVYNNTFYSTTTATTRGVRIESGAVNTVVKNNLCYFTGGTTCVNDLGTGTVAATNTGDIGTISTDPSFDGPTSTPSGFRISTSSYAATGATAIYPASNDDFFNCEDNTSAERLGAFVPRARSRCKSSAGP